MEEYPITAEKLGVAGEWVELLPKGSSVQKYIDYKIGCAAGRENIDDSFCVMDLGKLVQTHLRWVQALPNVQPFYAVKCNDDDMLLNTLATLGTGFDCASTNEMKKILNLKVSPDRIVFAHPCKQLSHLKYAKENDIKMLTADCESELHKIKKHFPEAKVLLRISADCQQTLFPMSKKFGCSEEEARDLLQLAKSLELEVLGISFHIGTHCQDATGYNLALETSYELFKYAEALGLHMTILDIGGGFPGRNEEDSHKLFTDMAAEIRKGLKKFSRFSNLKIISEPGAFYGRSCMTIVTNVTCKKCKKMCNGEEAMMEYYINNSVYGLFHMSSLPPPFPDLLIKPKLLKDYSAKKRHQSILWGYCLASLDKIKECELPELEEGDWIYFDNMGAYSLVLSTPFNGFERPHIYYCISASERHYLTNLLGEEQVSSSEE